MANEEATPTLCASYSIFQLASTIMSTAATMMSSGKQLPRSEWPTITEFYSGHDIFITGATGFMGKCLVEKILRSLPTAGRVFVLVRPKKGKSVQERVEDLTNTKLFQHLLTESPEMIDRIIPIAGDISKPGLGISKEDEEILVGSVSIVFHLAATIQFNERLRDSLQYNVTGVREMIKLCRKMKKLQSLIHVSTAYSNCQMNNIEEIIYTAPVDYNDLMQSANWMTDEQLELIVPSLLQGRPNTYTFTKALGESLLLNEAKDLPVAIFRPSIVGAAYKEPLPGWIDCIHGAAGLFIAVGKGMLRVMKINWNTVADIVPVDYVTNMLITIGWITALNKTPFPVVYHCNTGSRNPIDWGKLTGLMVKSYTENPFDEVFRSPHVVKCWPFIMWRFWQFILHYVPAYLSDCVFSMLGKKARMVRNYEKLENTLQQLDYFTQRTWQWSNQNYDKLLSLLSEEDKQTFNFDMTSLDWDKYISTFCMGTKKYLLNDNMSNLHQARQKLKRRRTIRYTINFVMFLLATQLLYLRSHIAREVWSNALGMCLNWLKKLSAFVIN